MVPDADWDKIYAITHRGFTDHEMLDDLDIVHMNGRLYDPDSGRFASADTILAEPGTQSFNRYSYVANNPLSFTDPTGHLILAEVTVESSSFDGGAFFFDYWPISGNPDWAVDFPEWEESDDPENLGTVTVKRQRPPASPRDPWFEGLGLGFIDCILRPTRFVAPCSAGRWGAGALNYGANIVPIERLAFAGLKGLKGLTAAEKALLKKIKIVNPKRGTKGGKTNCVNCAFATDATLAGNPTSALPGPGISPSELESVYGTQFVEMNGPWSITAELMQGGPGAQGIIAGYGADLAIGHVWNGVNVDGAVHYVDGQNGILASFQGYTELYLLRTR